MTPQKFPQYYVIDFDIFVKVEQNEDGTISAENHLGNPYPPAAALDGNPATKEAFEKAVKELGKI